MPVRAVETRKKILSASVRLFLEQGYKQTSITQIAEAAGVARGSCQNLFRTKDSILLDLVETMFTSQFGAARAVIGDEYPPVFVYAAETAIQMTLTELNEHLREIYVVAYTQPDIAEYIFRQTTRELHSIFGPYQPELTEEDFYALEIGSAGLMRGYMARPCDGELTLEKKLESFLTLSLRGYTVPEPVIRQTLDFLWHIDLRAVAQQIMEQLFHALEMRYDFHLRSKEEEQA